MVRHSQSAGVLHRFFDTCPISPSGRYLAVFQLPYEDRRPEPGEKGNVCIVDLETGEDRAVAETCGWEPQMGANINWGATDHELFFNDVDRKRWKPFAWKLDPLTGERRRMEGTVYHASTDGLVRINTGQPCKDSVMRIDPHPAWDRTWRYVMFNAYSGARGGCTWRI